MGVGIETIVPDHDLSLVGDMGSDTGDDTPNLLLFIQGIGIFAVIAFILFLDLGGRIGNHSEAHGVDVRKSANI